MSIFTRRWTTPGAGVNALLGGIGNAAVEFWDNHGNAMIDLGLMALTRGRGGFNSRTMARTTIGRTSARVDLELPGTHGPANIHVQTKGLGGNQKYRITDPSDLSGLPRSLRENEAIKRGIEKAFKLLESYKP